MENFRAIEFQKTRDFSNKMNATFEFVRQNFSGLIKSLLFIAGPPILLASFFMSNFYSRFLGLSLASQNNPEAMTEGLQEMFTGPSFFLQFSGIMIFMVLASVVTVSVVNNYMKEYEEKKTNRIEVSDVWERVRTTFFSYLGTMFFYWLLAVVGYVAVILLVVMFAAISTGLAVLFAIAAGIGFLYALMALSLLFPVRSFEKIGVVEAMSRSFYLIRGKWWSTFGLLMVNWLIGYFIALIFLIPWYIMVFINAMHSISQTSPVEATTTSSELIMNIFFMLYFLASILLQTLPLIAIAFQYFNLVERREAKGLLSRIDTLGQQAPPTVENEQY